MGVVQWRQGEVPPAPQALPRQKFIQIWARVSRVFENEVRLVKARKVSEKSFPFQNIVRNEWPSAEQWVDGNHWKAPGDSSGIKEGQW